jgi:hypothetical protein
MLLINAIGKRITWNDRVKGILENWLSIQQISNYFLFIKENAFHTKDGFAHVKHANASSEDLSDNYVKLQFQEKCLLWWNILQATLLIKIKVVSQMKSIVNVELEYV